MLRGGARTMGGRVADVDFFYAAFSWMRTARAVAREMWFSVRERRFYARNDIRIAIEFLDLALRNLIAANPWIVGE